MIALLSVKLCSYHTIRFYISNWWRLFSKWVVANGVMVVSTGLFHREWLDLRYLHSQHSWIVSALWINWINTKTFWLKLVMQNLPSCRASRAARIQRELQVHLFTAWDLALTNKLLVSHTISNWAGDYYELAIPTGGSFTLGDKYRGASPSYTMDRRHVAQKLSQLNARRWIRQFFPAVRDYNVCWCVALFGMIVVLLMPDCLSDVSLLGKLQFT